MRPGATPAGLANRAPGVILHGMTLRAPLSRAGGVLLLFLAACVGRGEGAPGPASATAPAGPPHPGEILDLRTGETLPDAGVLAARLARADVAILGERHDNPAHHRAQAEITGRIASHVAPAALVFEMIPPSENPEMAELRGRGAPGDAYGPLIGWDALGWPDWSYYAPILDAALDSPVLGAAVPREAVRAAMRDGAAAVFADALRGDPAALGLDQPLAPEVQAVMEAEQIEAHCGALPAEMAGPMVEAQRLRDAAFADAVLKALSPDAGPVVLITGAGHGRKDRAVPAYLAAAAPNLDVVSVAFAEIDPARPDEFRADAAVYDYLWFTEAHDRGDPCAAFRAAPAG